MRVTRSVLHGLVLTLLVALVSVASIGLYESVQIHSLLKGLPTESVVEPVSTEIRVVDPGDPKACLTVTVTADPGTPEEEAASLKEKINALYHEFGRCESG